MWLDHLILFLGWGVFYFLHSFLLKENVKKKIDLKPRTYRLFYNLLSLILIIVVLLVGAVIPSPLMYVPAPGTFYIGLMVSTVGIFVIKRAFRNYSTRVFLGVKKESMSSELKTQGLQGKIRHPLYTGTIMIFLGYFVYNPMLSSLITLVSLLIYLPFGIKMEENKLIDKFGQQYLDYRDKVPALLPKIHFNKNES